MTDKPQHPTDAPKIEKLDPEKVRELLREGRELRRELEVKMAPMRHLTPEDLKARAR